MILLTVGTQLPFDRFVTIIDRVAPILTERVFAQIGQGSYRPANMDWCPFVGPIEFERLIAQSSAIIAHAGIGTVVMAQKHRKPMVLFPRRASLGEHRNDHQLATVRALGARSGIRVALDGDELEAAVTLSHPAPEPDGLLPERDRLRGAITALLTEEQRRRAPDRDA